MKVLVVGSGGREHALSWALARSPRVDELYVAPGNGGTGDLGRNVAIAADDVAGIVQFARKAEIDLVVIGPEKPLALGLTDALQEAGIRTFGPSAEAACIESSKAYSKRFMREQGIPSADFVVFDDYKKARTYLDQQGAPIVVKASGLAAGKGAIVCQSKREAYAALDLIMRERKFGSAGDLVVIEECLQGQEVSVLAFTDGETVVPMILSQDHKPAYDGDRGPNTGGMGCYAPAPLLDDETLAEVERKVLQRAVDGLREAGRHYVGVLYAGLMLSDEGFRVLEFNCRFGDPETQVILPLLDTDLTEIIDACIDGHLDQIDLCWSDQTCVCVVMASGGYPESYETGYPIEGLAEAQSLPDTVVFHAGTKRVDDSVVTAGGRVLGVTAWGNDLSGAMQRAYAGVERIDWKGATYRSDIGAKGLQEED